MPDKVKTVVLVVEDEPLILMDAMQSLEDAGFEVLDAYDAEHALLRLEERPDINAMFTDVNMPGRFDGVQLARMVNERRADLVILVTSGAVKVKRADLPEGGQFIPKPYRGEQVAKLIEELIGAGTH
ncbi:MAG: response regulator [Caulobacteraceae bacterium]